MTSQKLNEEHEILRRFMAVVLSSAFKNSLNGGVAATLSRVALHFATLSWISAQRGGSSGKFGHCQHHAML